MVKRRLDGSGCRHADGGYCGLVKHAEQVRYVPREAFARAPFRIAFGVDLMDEKRVSLRAHFAGAAWLLGFGAGRRPRHYQVVTR